MDLSDIKCSYQQDDEYYLTPVSIRWKNRITNYVTQIFLRFILDQSLL